MSFIVGPKNMVNARASTLSNIQRYTKNVSLQLQKKQKTQSPFTAPKGISVGKISGTKINFALRIKTGANLSSLSYKTKVSLRNKLSDIHDPMISRLKKMPDCLKFFQQVLNCNWIRTHNHLVHG